MSTLVGLGDETAAIVAHRYDELIAYQGESYAQEYLAHVVRVHTAGLGDDLTGTVAANLYKLMAYKDEYEVARLTDDAGFTADVENAFGTDARTAVRLHPPVLRALGRREKIAFGARSRPVLRALAKMKRLRGTALDPFGHTEVRRTERALVLEYRATVDELLARLGAAPTPDRLAAAAAIAGLPDMVRGYEGVKMRNVQQYRTEVTRRLAALG